MYLDLKKIIYAVFILLMGVMAWWFTAQKNAATERLIENLDAGAPGGEKAQAIVREFDAALKRSRRQMQAGAYAAAASTARRPFSSFENLLRSRPRFELESGMSLEAWFAEEQATFREAVEAAYEEVLAALSAGDLSRDEARSFVSRMPYPFKGNLERQFRTDLESVRAKRAELADEWVLVRAGASFGHGMSFENAVYEALRERWPAESPYKLVVGRPLSPAEERAAAKIYQIYMTGETVHYEAEEEAFKRRGTGDLLTSVSVEWIDRSKNPNAIDLNWDDLSAKTVRVDVPEKFSVQFENQRQMADFDRVEAEQRKRVLKAFKKSIASWPQAKIMSPSN